MFRGTCAGYVAALQLTESSSPGAASGFARYQKPISLVLTCAADQRNQRYKLRKANGRRRTNHTATVAYIITDHLIISLYVCIWGSDDGCRWPRYVQGCTKNRACLFVCPFLLFLCLSPSRLLSCVWTPFSKERWRERDNLFGKLNDDKTANITLHVIGCHDDLNGRSF